MHSFLMSSGGARLRLIEWLLEKFAVSLFLFNSLHSLGISPRYSYVSLRCLQLLLAHDQQVSLQSKYLNKKLLKFEIYFVIFGFFFENLIPYLFFLFLPFFLLSPSLSHSLPFFLPPLTPFLSPLTPSLSLSPQN